MKRTIRLTVALLAVITAASACNKESIGEPRTQGGDGIRFTADLVCSLTRAFSETTVSAMQTGGIRAAALCDSDGSALFNEKFVYDSGSATYGAQGKNYYYPSSGTLSFYGVFPSSQEITVSGGKASLAYSQNGDTDLVAATALRVSSRPTAVQMSFQHILSQASFTVKGDQGGLDFKIKSLKVTAPNGGTYSFENGMWTPSGTTGDYPVISSDKTVGSTKTAVGSPMSFLPGVAKLSVAWECYGTGTSTLVCSKNATVDITLTQGNHSTFNITLPSGSSELMFETTVETWTVMAQDVMMKNFCFTVDNDGKQVEFSPGNLYWDGKNFNVEEHQYDYPTEWSPSHVGHFYWSKTASIAYAASYNDPGKTTSDKFFAADGGAIEGWTVLSKDEWDYLIAHSVEGGSSAKRVTIDGKNCIILKPDGFDGAVADTYTAEQWTAVEATGLVALPFAGDRDGIDLDFLGAFGCYWSGSPDPSNSGNAGFSSYVADTGFDSRYFGFSVRLVKVVGAATEEYKEEVVEFTSTDNGYTVLEWAKYMDVFLVNAGTAGTSSAKAGKGGAGGNILTQDNIEVTGAGAMTVTIGQSTTTSGGKGGQTKVTHNGVTYNPTAQGDNSATGAGSNGTAAPDWAGHTELFGAGGAAGATSGSAKSGGTTGGGNGGLRTNTKTTAATAGSFYGAGGGGGAYYSGTKSTPQKGGYQGIAIIRFRNKEVPENN